MDCRSFVRFGVLTVLLSTPAIASAQDRQIPSDRLVTITVAEDRPYTIAHSIVVEAGQPVYARTGAELEGRSWTATRTSERGTETIHSDACPALRTIALSFAPLPPVQVRPMPSVAHGGEPADICLRRRRCRQPWRRRASRRWTTRRCTRARRRRIPRTTRCPRRERAGGGRRARHLRGGPGDARGGAVLPRHPRELL